MGWSASTTAKMAKRYGNFGSDVQRTALDALVQTPTPGDKDGRPRAKRAPDLTPHS
jgi:hypothetical protein